MAELKNIIVVGAGGNLGPSVVNGLLQSPHKYNVSALSRQESSYEAPAGVTLVKTEYSHAALVDALKGQDAVVSTIGATVGEQTKIIDAAIEAGVKRFITSEFGSDTAHPQALERVPFFAGKKQIRDYLISKEDKLEWSGIITGAFFDWGLRVGFLGFNLSTQTATLDPKYKGTRFSVSNLTFIGQAVAQSLAPAIAPKTANKLLYVHSFSVSQASVLAAIEKVGGKKWTETAIDIDAQVKEAREKIQKGDYSSASTLIVANILSPDSGNAWDERGILANELLELPAEDLEATIKKALT